MNSKRWYELSDVVLIFLGAGVVFLGYEWVVVPFVAFCFLGFFFARAMAKALKIAEESKAKYEEKVSLTSDTASLLKLAKSMGFGFCYEAVACLKDDAVSGLGVVKLKRASGKVTETLKVGDFRTKHFDCFFVIYNDEMLIAFLDELCSDGLVFIK